MDIVLVLDKGAIVQQGRFEQLNVIPGLFKQMQIDELHNDHSEQTKQSADQIIDPDHKELNA